MRYYEIKVDRVYKINYKASSRRLKLWVEKLLPKAGTRVLVTDKRGEEARLPIGIKEVGSDKSYLCRPEDLIPINWKRK